jgi:hypothetical protein
MPAMNKKQIACVPLLMSFLWLALSICSAMAQNAPVDIAREIIAPLIDPVKVATLKGDRPANERLYKVLYWLEMARLGGVGIGDTIDKAQVHLNIEKTVGGACGNLMKYEEPVETIWKAADL